MVLSVWYWLAPVKHVFSFVNQKTQALSGSHLSVSLYTQMFTALLSTNAVNVYKCMYVSHCTTNYIIHIDKLMNEHIVFLFGAVPCAEYICSFADNV